MAKRKMSENSLKNLEKGKPFSSDCEEIARKAQEKSVEKRKENKAFSEACKIILDGNQEYLLKDLMSIALNPDTPPEIKIKLTQLFADYSGQKPKERIDTTIKSYSLFEEETENKAEKLESEQQSKKTNKK